MEALNLLNRMFQCQKKFLYEENSRFLNEKANQTFYLFITKVNFPIIEFGARLSFEHDMLLPFNFLYLDLYFPRGLFVENPRAGQLNA